MRKRRKHLNRSKRKREYRMSKRGEELWKVNRLYHDEERLRKFGNIETPGFMESLIKKIYNAKSVNDVMLESFAYGESDRVASSVLIIESFLSLIVILMFTAKIIG